MLTNIIDEGYRLTYGGYDYLAIKALCARGVISGVGTKVGVGKESGINNKYINLIAPINLSLDIYICINDNEEQMIMKLHR